MGGRRLPRAMGVATRASTGCCPMVGDCCCCNPCTVEARALCWAKAVSNFASMQAAMKEAGNQHQCLTGGFSVIWVLPDMACGETLYMDGHHGFKLRKFGSV